MVTTGQPELHAVTNRVLFMAVSLFYCSTVTVRNRYMTQDEIIRKVSHNNLLSA